MSTPIRLLLLVDRCAKGHNLVRCFAATVLCVLPARGFSSEVQFLGALDGYGAKVTSLSHDGRAASGWNTAHVGTNYVGFVWRNSQDRHDFQATGASTIFHAISADGGVTVGSGAYPGLPLGNLYKVSLQNTILDLGRPAGVTGFAVATSTSSDGSTIVGHFQSNQRRTAFRWTPQTGAVVLHSRFDGRTATGVSADGSVICGWAGYALPLTHAFVWREGMGITQLPWHPDIPNPAFASAEAKAISGDGRTIIGFSDGPRNLEALKWVDGVPQRFVAPNGWVARNAYGVNFDGSVVLGTMSPLNTPFDNGVAFIQTPELGIMETRAFFRHHGAVLPPTAQVNVYSVSGDGLSFGGGWYDPAVSTNEQGFIFTVPSPGGTAAILLSAALVVARRRRA